MKIASIEKINKILPHPNADALEIAQVLGWRVVVKKGEFQEGQLVVYVAIDSVLEDRPEYEFLRNKGFKIKTIKLRGEVSQGICFPVSLLKDVELVEGKDVSKEMGASHYEKPIPAQLAGKIKGHFPWFLRKTDELNLRSYPNAVRELFGKFCYITQKIDGCSGTYYFENDVFGVCSRNLDLAPEEGNSFWKVAKLFNIEQALKAWKERTGESYAVQGECYGAGIQGNKLGLASISFAAFNLFNITKQVYADYTELTNFCEANSIPMVPQIFMGEFTGSLETLEKLAEEQKYPNGAPAEGIVIRPLIERQSAVLEGRLSGKVLNNKFLLKHGE
jgi:RNA ligase (TIGR02306 family)